MVINVEQFGMDTIRHSTCLIVFVTLKKQYYQNGVNHFWEVLEVERLKDFFSSL